MVGVQQGQCSFRLVSLILAAPLHIHNSVVIKGVLGVVYV